MDPFTLALFGGGTVAKIAGGLISRNDAMNNANNIAAARNAALRDSLARQKVFADENRGFFNTRMGDYAPGAQDALLAAVQGNRSAAITGNQTAPSDGSDIPVSRSAPKVVRGEIAKRMLESFNDSTDRAKAMGKLGGYSDQWQNNDLGLRDTSRRVNTNNNFSQAEASILANQMDLAEMGTTKKSSIWGPILSAGGDLATSMAGSGMFKSAAPGAVRSSPSMGFALPTQRA